MMNARDPRSLLELRRLAYRAKRIPGMRDVLHDALLESFPNVYEEAIRRAHREVAHGVEKFIIFLPSRLGPKPGAWARSGRRPEKWRKHSAEMFFSIMDNVSPGREDTKTSALESRFFRSTGAGTLPNLPSFRSAIIVYRTRGAL